MVWICPICELSLEKNQQSWSCDNQHSFDQAKEGYVNLLPAHQKRSKNPGDNPEMVLGRRTIHEAHLYQPLADVLTNIVADCKHPCTLLDIGSGEGYYGGLIARSVPGVTVYGIDIAKSAVKLAAKSTLIRTLPWRVLAICQWRRLVLTWPCVFFLPQQITRLLGC